MMNEHLFGFISSIVAGIVTNGIQGVSHYITKETLQDHIANTIGAVQLLYEKKFDCKDKSLFIWQENIEYYIEYYVSGVVSLLIHWFIYGSKLSVDEFSKLVVEIK